MKKWYGIDKCSDSPSRSIWKKSSWININSIFTYRSLASWTKWSANPNRRHIGDWRDGVYIFGKLNAFVSHTSKHPKMVQKYSRNARYWKHLNVNYFSKTFPFPHFPVWDEILKFIRALRLMLRAVELKFKRNSFLFYAIAKKSILNLSFASFSTNGESMRHPNQRRKKECEQITNDANDGAKIRYFPHQNITKLQNNFIFGLEKCDSRLNFI